MADFPTFKGSWPWPLIGSYCIPSCITHRPLPTYRISWKSKKRFGRTYGRADIWYLINRVSNVRPYVLRPSTKSFFDFHEIRYAPFNISDQLLNNRNNLYKWSANLQQTNLRQRTTKRSNCVDPKQHNFFYNQVNKSTQKYPQIAIIPYKIHDNCHLYDWK